MAPVAMCFCHQSDNCLKFPLAQASWLQITCDCIGGGAVELQLLKNVAEVHVNTNADAAGVAAAASGETPAAVPGGAITCKIDPTVNAILATCCTNLDVDSALPFQVTSTPPQTVACIAQP